MSLGYLSAIGAIDVTKAREFQVSLRSLAVLAKWPAIDPGRVDGVLTAKTGQALVTLITAAPGIPSSVKTVVRILAAFLTANTAFSGAGNAITEAVNKFIVSNASYITTAINGFKVVYALRSPGSAAAPPPPSSAPPPASSSTSGRSAPGGSAPPGAFASIPIAVKIGVPAVLVLVLLLK